MIRYFLIISFFVSCSKVDLEPDTYDVQIKNNYFEVIDSVKFGNNYLGTIPIASLSETFSVEKNVYVFSCLTFSQLKITAEVEVQGSSPKLFITLNNNGKVELE